MAKDDGFCNRAEAYEANVPLNPADRGTIGDVILRRYSRRAVVRGSLGVVAAAVLFGPAALASRPARAEVSEDRFGFAEVEAGVDETHHVARGYDAQVLLRWGDPLFPDSPPFDPRAQSAAAQLKQFGYNNDYVGFIPLDQSGTRGLLCVNHEYTNEEVMFPGIGRQDTTGFKEMTAELVEIEMAASSAVRWGLRCAVPASRLTRRRCSSRSSIRAPTAPMRSRASSAPPASMIPPPAGPISILPCRRALPCSPSPRSAAARSREFRRDDERGATLGVSKQTKGRLEKATYACELTPVPSS
jgi:Bacterial protein of unknown function (DUF839)